MKRMLQTMRYLMKSIVNPTLFALAVMVCVTAILDFSIISTGRVSLTGSAAPITMPFELTSGCFSILIGAAIFLTNFRVSLANGISRRTFMLANLPVAMLIAAFFSIATLVMTKALGLFWPINSWSDTILLNNPKLSIVWPMIFQFSLYLFLILAGRFISMVYYRCNKWGRGILSLVPLLIFIPMLLINRGGNSVFYPVIISSFGLLLQPENIISFLFFGSLLMFALTWLVIYRAPLKD